MTFNELMGAKICDRIMINNNDLVSILTLIVFKGGAGGQIALATQNLEKVPVFAQ